MTIWIKTIDGKNIKLKDGKWHAKIFASGEACNDNDYLVSRVKNYELIHSTKYVYKIPTIVQNEKCRVLEIELEDASKIKKLGEALENAFQNPDYLQLYNVDVLPEQQYFYDKELFPLAYVEVEEDNEEINHYSVLDNVSDYNYSLPKLKTLKLEVEISDLVLTLDSKLISITLFSLDSDFKKEIAKIDGSEENILHRLMEEIDSFDPDLIVTQNGDAFVFPLLYAKASKLSIDISRLNRDDQITIPKTQGKETGKTYFSYGRILYRPKTHRLFGRLHLDEQNTFIYDQCKIQGLFEVSRLCRMPLHTAMRASIGKCLSSLQFYYAHKRDILIPWKPEIVEDSKNAYELFMADRGGLVLKPLPGVHEHVGEIDFASLYPSIIRNYNISAETVNCSCCQDSKFQIEELKMHICEKREGIIARSLVMPLDKRFEYKRLRDSAVNDEILKQTYNERAGALKWILVCCFGYLSYRNAKFGKIDSHIAVCALARKALVDAMHTSEYSGFRVIHGIVDSLWLSKDNASLSDYEELKVKIESENGFKLSIEGIYKWIVFLPSKNYSERQVANRYFGVFEGTNKLKVRGIEIRRRDTPPYFKKCQQEILDELARCDNKKELKHCARWKCIQIFERYSKDLEEHKVSLTELIITRRLSKNPGEYSSKRQLQVNAADHLAQKGLKLQAGQSISYVITRYKSAGKDRSIPRELLEDKIEYDSYRYIELLADCCSTILSPFGVSKDELITRSQSLLSWT